MMKEYFKAHSISSLIYITAGAILAGIAIEEFLVPNNLFDGGITGISMILNHFLKVKLGILIFCFNLPFAVLAYRQMNRVFVFKMVYAISVMSLTTALFQPVEGVTDEVILAVVYGGLLLGTGVGLVLKGGGCLDGTEVVAVVLGKKTSLSVGQVVLSFNIVIFVVAGLIFNMDRGLYSILMYAISSKVIDIIDIGYESTKSVMMITDDGDALADAIYEKLGRTVTFIPGEGYVSGQVKYMLYCVVTRAEIHDLKEIVRDHPGSVFTTVSDVSEIIGNHVKTKG